MKLQIIKEKIFESFIMLVFVWVIVAAIFQFSMLGLELTGHEETLKKVGNWLDVRIDGRFKDDPRNILYTKK
jgi:hypothetical protein